MSQLSGPEGNNLTKLEKGTGYLEGEWIYTDSTGKRHLLTNEGYSRHFKSTYWTSAWNATDCDFWTQEYCDKYGYNIERVYCWCVGTYALTRKALIKRIEEKIQEASQ